MKSSDFEKINTSFAERAFQRLVLLALTLIPGSQVQGPTNQDINEALNDSLQNTIVIPKEPSINSKEANVEPNQKESDFEETTSELFGEWGTNLDETIRKFLEDPEPLLEPSESQKRLQEALGDIFEP